MRFQCSHCAAVLEGDPAAGEAFNCTQCGAVSVVPSGPFAPGAVLGDYAVQEELAEENGARLLAAVQISTPTPAHLRIPNPARLTAPGAADDFFRRAAEAAKIRHPHLAGVIEAGTEDGVFFLASEAVAGTSLKHVLAHSGRLLPERALDIAIRVNQALDFAWRQERLAHLEVSLYTILLTENDSVVLTGLGMPQPNLDLTNLSSEAELGDTAGMAPERLIGKPDADNRSDIYSLGAVLYQCLTGKPPYMGSRPSETAQRHLLEPLTPARQRLPSLAAPVSRLLDIMLAKRPEHRHQDGAELDADLALVRAGKPPAHPLARGSQKPLKLTGPLRVAGRAVPPPVVKKTLPPALWIGLAAAAAALAVAGGLWMGSGRKPTPAPKPTVTPALAATPSSGIQTATTPPPLTVLQTRTTAPVLISPPATPQPPPAPPVAPQITSPSAIPAAPKGGLKTLFFVGKNLATPVLTRTDSRVNFYWADGEPARGIPNVNFSVRWIGQIQPRYSEEYQLFGATDDGSKLWVDNTLIYSNWQLSNTESSGKIRLEAGKKVNICLDVFQCTGNAKAFLSWSSPSQPREIIPASCLSPDYVGQPPEVPVPNYTKNALPPPATPPKDTVPKPVIQPPGGLYRILPAVTITCEMPEAVIRYTLDSSSPKDKSPAYEAPLKLKPPFPVHMHASTWRQGWKHSEDAVAVYSLLAEELTKRRSLSASTTSAADHLLQNTCDGKLSKGPSPDIFYLKKDQSATFTVERSRGVMELRIAKPYLDAKSIRIEANIGSKDSPQWVLVMDSLKLTGPTGTLNSYPLPFAPGSSTNDIRITALANTVYLDEIEFLGAK